MRKILLALALLFPLIGFSQSKADEYAIYSNYLRAFDKERGGRHTFAIKIASDYNNYRDASYITDVLDDFRDYVKNKKAGFVFSARRDFLMDTLKKETLWLPLISKLIRQMHKPYVIKNYFSKDLRVFLLPYTEYYKYYGATNGIGIDEEWAAFHENYPDHAVLADLSEVVSDGKRAVFYFGWRCGGLCGDGSLVMLYNDGSGWRVVTSITMWYN
jgi:hypothetical protein